MRASRQRNSAPSTPPLTRGLTRRSQWSPVFNRVFSTSPARASSLLRTTLPVVELTVIEYPRSNTLSAESNRSRVRGGQLVLLAPNCAAPVPESLLRRCNTSRRCSKSCRGRTRTSVPEFCHAACWPALPAARNG